jgi:hypothetical protein
MRTQMQFTIRSAAVAALLVAGTAAPVAAQGRAAFAARTPVPAGLRHDTVQVERARELLERAQRRWYAYDIKRARRDFARATDIMLDHDVYAGPALVSLAHATYASGEVEQAARVLVDAAVEAARFGDLELQVTSLHDASLVYLEAGNVKEAKSILADVRRLLASPYLPAATKAEIERRMALGE